MLSQSLKNSTTAEVYQQLESLLKNKASVSGIHFEIYEQANSAQQKWVSLSFDNYAFHNIEKVLEQINQLRDNFFKEENVDLSLDIEKCKFDTGQNFEDWIAENRLSVEAFKSNISQ